MMNLEEQLRKLLREGRLSIPLPGRGATAERHRRLIGFGREDLSLARLAEAHVDATAILGEAGRAPDQTALYGVWASEMPEQFVRLDPTSRGLELNGSKAFCSGAGLIDRALVTVLVPERRLVEVDLRRSRASLVVDATGWISCAFAQTSTGTVVFNHVPIQEQDLVCPPGWYLERSGFWHGACGPAACWAGGAIGLIDHARTHARDDPHMRAHLGALHTHAWVMEACLDAAGREIDDGPADARAAHVRALTVRQVIEDCCADVLRRFARAFGPRPLAYDRDLSRRYQELELYIRQSHGEHDLESLGRMAGIS